MNPFGSAIVAMEFLGLPEAARMLLVLGSV